MIRKISAGDAPRVVRVGDVFRFPDGVKRKVLRLYGRGRNRGAVAEPLTDRKHPMPRTRHVRVCYLRNYQFIEQATESAR